MHKGITRRIIVCMLLVSLVNFLNYPFLRIARSSYASEISVMIIPSIEPSKSNPAVIDELIKAFKDTGKFDVVARQEVERFAESKRGMGLTTAKNFDAVFNEAVDLLDKGQKLYNSLKVDEAITTLQDAKLKFKEAIPTLQDEASYSRFLGAYFYLCMAYQAKQQELQAKQELREMVIVDSKRKQRKFSSNYYPPQVLKLYEEVRKEIINAEGGRLKIKASPSSAKVYLDGGYAGETPVEVSRLPLGEHFVTINKDGYISWSDSKLIVSGDNTVEVDLKEKPKVGGALADVRPVNSSYDISKDVSTLLDEMGISLGGDIFLLYDYSSKGNEAKLSAQLYDQRNQEVSKTEEVKIGDVSKPQDAFGDLARRLSSYLSAEGYVVASSVKTADNGETEKAKPPIPAGQPALENQDETGTSLEGDESKDWEKGTLPHKKPGEPKAWYEKGWVWGVILGSLALSAGGVLLFTDIAKVDATKSTFLIKR